MDPHWPTLTFLTGAQQRLSLSLCSLQRFTQRVVLSAHRPKLSRASRGQPRLRVHGSLLKFSVAGCCAAGGALLAGADSPRLPGSAGLPVTRSRSRSEGGPFSPDRRVTDVMIGVNVLMFLAQMATNQAITAAGVKYNPAIASGQWWRLITPAFLHGNLMHLFVNCYSLANLGPLTERLSGSSRFATVYLLAAVASTSLSYVMSPAPSLGASGAVFGVGGALAMFFYRHKDELGRSSDTVLRQLGQSLMMNLMYGLFSSNIDNWGHLGGLVGGAAAAFLLGPSYQVAEGRDGKGRRQRVLVDRPPLPFMAFKPLPMRS